MFWGWFAEQFTRHRLLLAAASLAVTAWAAWGTRYLVFDDVPRSVFQSDSPEFADLDRLLADFGTDDNDCLIVVESPELFSPGVIAMLRRLVDDVAATPGVATVRSLADVAVFAPGRPAHSLLPADDASPAQRAEARRLALAHPLLAGQVLSADGTTALVVARLEGASAPVARVEQTVALLRGHLESARRLAPQCRIRLTGVPPIRAEIFAAVRRDSLRFVIIGVVVAVAMATVLFRRPWAVAIVSLAPIAGTLWTMGAMGWFGERLNVINTVLPTLIMVVGFADAVHLMVDIRHSCRLGLVPLLAAKNAIRHLGVACFMTSLTTAVGFGSLVVAEVQVISRFGATCAVGVLMAFLAVMVLVPLTASTPAGRRLEVDVRFDPLDWPIRRLTPLVRWVLAHPRAVAVAGTCATLLLAAGALRLRPDHRLSESIPQDNESVQAMHHLDRVLGGTLTIFVVVDWPQQLRFDSPQVLAALGEVERILDARRDVFAPLSILDVLRALPGRDGDLAARAGLVGLAPPDLVRRFLRTDLRRTIVTGRLTDAGTDAHQLTFAELEAALAPLAQHYPGFRFKLTGTTVVASQNILQMIRDLVASLLMAAVVIFATLTVALRSLRLGLIAILPNVFPLAVTGTVLWATGHYLQLTSVIVFSISLGIAVDDTIHFLNRYRREAAAGADTDTALLRTFHAVGSAMITTSLVLLVGFASVLSSEMPSSRLFAWMAMVSVGAALLGDLVILPALLKWFAPLSQPPRPAPQGAHCTLRGAAGVGQAG